METAPIYRIDRSDLVMWGLIDLAAFSDTAHSLASKRKAKRRARILKN
ncbi:MAG: hypothetical protein WA790_19580 [Sulfitobacter sp.]